MTERTAQSRAETSFRALADVDPYPAFARAAERGPVAWDESFNGWVVLDYPTCAEVLKNTEMFPMPWNSIEGGHVALGRHGIFNLTGHEHETAHKVLLDYFNPRKNPDLGAMVRRITAECFERAMAHDEFDFVAAIAQRVPGMMAFAFLGIAPSDEGLRTIHVANRALQVFMQSYGDSPDAVAQLHEAHAMLEPYFGAAVESRRTDRRNDLISLLWNLSDERGDWDHDEMIAQCLFYFGASFGNTANTIANAAYLLLTDPDMTQQLASDPAATGTYVDEVMRAWAAVQFRIRVAAADGEIAGQPIEKGDRVVLAVASANRDDALFPHSDTIDVARSNSRRHLTFGLGPRYCVGALLARLEVEEVVTTLIRLGTRVRLTSPEPNFDGLVYRLFEPLTMTVAAV